MNRRRGRRSTRRDIEELIAEICQARIEWDALPIEERIRRGQGGHAQHARLSQGAVARWSLLRLGAIHPPTSRTLDRGVRQQGLTILDRYLRYDGGICLGEPDEANDG
jgi:hypothetical protein